MIAVDNAIWVAMALVERCASSICRGNVFAFFFSFDNSSLWVAVDAFTTITHLVMSEQFSYDRIRIKTLRQQGDHEPPVCLRTSRRCDTSTADASCVAFHSAIATGMALSFGLFKPINCKIHTVEVIENQDPLGSYFPFS